MSLADEYVPPAPSLAGRALWWCAGADAGILRRCPFSEQAKYFCLGGIVLSVGVMAGLAGGYAFYTIFAPKTTGTDDPTHLPSALIAAVFGLLWGLIIFNLDRYIVASTGKGDGTDEITGKEFRNALPRIGMAIIIGITISKPVETRIFKPEIDQRLFGEMQQLKAQNKQKVEVLYADKLRTADAEMERLRAEIRTQDSVFQQAQLAATREADGTGGSGRASTGPIYQRKKAVADAEAARLAKLEQVNGQAIEAQRLELARLRAEQDSAIAAGDKSVTGVGGLLKRMQLAHEVAGDAISWAITLVFLAIELTPIFFKLMIIKGPYDYLEEHVKELLKAERGIALEHEFEGMGPGFEIPVTRFHAAEQALRTRKTVLEEQGRRQRQAMESWSRKTADAIDADPDRFVEEPPKGG